VVYNILSDESLRGEYDKIRKAKLQKSLQKSQLEELTKKFQNDLLHSESKLKKDNRTINIEQLREDGIKRRRLHEQQFISNKRNLHYVSFQDLPSPEYISITSSTSNPRVQVKWKYKRELGDYFDETVLHQIMQIFGPIASVTVDPHKSGARYDSGTIQYERAGDSQKACSHDFRKSASLWDGTTVRKVASLVRECKEVSSINSVVEDILGRYNG
jgi:DnaJ family protein C protein 17